jgi:hypothetical protein
VSRVRPVAALLVVIPVLLALSAAARTGKPAVPADRDPGGPAIAVVGDGVDYRDPDIARRLARDGEGEIIGWDFVDDDNRPLADPAEESAALARALVPDARLIPIRFDRSQPQSLASALGFAARSPALIVVVAGPLTTDRQSDVIRQAALRFEHLLLIVPVRALSSPDAAPAADTDVARIANVLTVAVEVMPQTSHDAAPIASCTGASLLVQLPAGAVGHGSPIARALAATAGAALPAAPTSGRPDGGAHLKARLLQQLRRAAAESSPAGALKARLAECDVAIR